MESRALQSSYLFLNGIRQHYYHWLPDEEDLPVLLLHGLASNARIWERLAPRLAEDDLAVYAPDLRGHGLTDGPEGDYGFDTYARDLVALVEALQLEQPLIVGHSWGAMLALDYAARFPIGPLAPGGIVLVDGGMSQLNDRPGATWEETRARLTPPPLAGMPLEDFLERLRRWNTRWQPDDEAVQVILGNFEISEDEKIYPRLRFENHMKIVRAMWDFPTIDRYSRLNCPVLLIPARPPEPRSEDESAYLDMKAQGIEKIRRVNPRVEVHWMENSIHDIPLQHPGPLADQILRFIDEHF